MIPPIFTGIKRLLSINKAHTWMSIFSVIPAVGVAAGVVVLTMNGGDSKGPTVEAPTWTLGQYWEMAGQDWNAERKEWRDYVARESVLGEVNNLAHLDNGIEYYLLSRVVRDAEGTPLTVLLALVSQGEFELYEYARESATRFVPTTRLWNFPMNQGDRFHIGFAYEEEVSAEVGEYAAVQTTAGEYDAYRIHRDGTKPGNFWYSPSVASDVKWELDDGTTVAELRITEVGDPTSERSDTIKALDLLANSPDRDNRFKAISPLEVLAVLDIERDSAIELLDGLKLDPESVIRDEVNHALDHIFDSEH